MTIRRRGVHVAVSPGEAIADARKHNKVSLQREVVDHRKVRGIVTVNLFGLGMPLESADMQMGVDANLIMARAWSVYSPYALYIYKNDDTVAGLVHDSGQDACRWALNVPFGPNDLLKVGIFTTGEEGDPDTLEGRFLLQLFFDGPAMGNMLMANVK